MSGQEMTPEQAEAYDRYCREEECPECGPVTILEVLEGAPSMTGSGHDPEALDLSCGHRLTWSPLDGRASVRRTPGAWCGVCGERLSGEDAAVMYDPDSSLGEYVTCHADCGLARGLEVA